MIKIRLWDMIKIRLWDCEIQLVWGIKKLMTMGYNKLWPPKLVYMHFMSIPTCINFLSQFQWIKFFDDHGIVHGQKGKFGCF